MTIYTTAPDNIDSGFAKLEKPTTDNTTRTYDAIITRLISLYDRAINDRQRNRITCLMATIGKQFEPQLICNCL